MPSYAASPVALHVRSLNYSTHEPFRPNGVCGPTTALSRLTFVRAASFGCQEMARALTAKSTELGQLLLGPKPYILKPKSLSFMGRVSCVERTCRVQLPCSCKATCTILKQTTLLSASGRPGGCGALVRRSPWRYDCFQAEAIGKRNKIC